MRGEGSSSNKAHNSQHQHQRGYQLGAEDYLCSGVTVQ